ncbi:hypothetical protein HLB44_29805 [Aquincola sp. S2]|uniref:Periplasmic heavy metal sensor n=1 Tax=Pseudaquabacterium terrae TaxID=2732868 RepID=A0ABX2ERD6_9BURK|nr:hypothetical protein [Aquabacterium terrae]NRF71196.1 hypothetical protein [Aquabacterium terrae]
MKTNMRRTTRTCLTAGLTTLVLVASTAASAQGHANAYAGEQNRSIKSLSERDIAALIDGQGAGLAKAAELNGYPGPAHTLELRAQLALSSEQAAATERLMSEHKQRARDLGARLVEAERRLDVLFADRRASAESVEDAARDVGQLQARLRAEHLKTHLAQTALLSGEQVRTYNQLRGYAAAVPEPTPSGSDASHSHHR